MLLRRVRKAVKHYKPESDVEAQWHQWVEETIAKMVDLGLVNDETFAKNRATSLHRRGDSKRMMSSKLRQKGLSTSTIEQTLADYDDDASELDAAHAYIKRRRLGSYRTKANTTPRDFYDKDLASLARNGFSYAIAKQALDAHSETKRGIAICLR